MASYISDYTGKQIDAVIKLFNNKGLQNAYGILVRKVEDDTFAAIDGTNYKIDWNWIDGNTIPTTLSGYGITDAKIENGTIILGSNSIIPVPTSMIETTATDSDSKISTSKAMRAYVDTYGGKIDTISVNGAPQTITNKNVNLIVATLENGKIPQSQLPSYVDDVLEFANRSAFPISGESGKIYVALDTNLTYRWSGSEYVEISQSLALGETDSTAYRGDRGKIAYDHAIAKGSQFASGLYKIETNSEGHVTAAIAVQKSDLTGLGVQEALVSGTNIKTINNQSLLGSGNINIQGGGSGLQNLVDGSATGSVRGIGASSESSSYTMGLYAFAEGSETTASGNGSHAEGGRTKASSYYSHAEGYSTTASGGSSHAQNYGTIAAKDYQTAIGKYNIEDTETVQANQKAFIIGNGTDGDNRSNALTVDWQGNVDIASGAKYKINGIPLSASDVGAQPTLVSGTNIKTINNQSILGSGDITVSTVAAQIVRW